MGAEDLSRNGVMWDEYGHTMVDDENWWMPIPAGEGNEEAYATGYKNEKKEPKMSSQLCTAWAPIYMTATDGVSPHEDIADEAQGYWDLKNGGEMTM